MSQENQPQLGVPNTGQENQPIPAYAKDRRPWFNRKGPDNGGKKKA